jgi:hypothetical protein
MRTFCLAIALLCATLYSQAIVLNNPNGGAVYSAGQKIPVSWTSSGSISSVQVSFQMPNGKTYSIATEQPATGSVQWTVPYLISAAGRVRVLVAAQNISNPPTDSSDNPFAISAAAPDA